MPIYFETKRKANGEVSYQFVKRMNPKAGNFPLFKEKVSFKLKASSVAEATREAKTAAAALDLLQVVARRDAGKHINSTKDMNKAAETWLQLVVGVDLGELLQLKEHKRHTEAALEATKRLELLLDEIVQFYGASRFDHDGSVEQWLSDFGSHLLAYLKEGQGVGAISEGVEIYLRQTQRDHLDEKTNSVRTVHRVVSYFVDIVGDKQLDQINRKDVERYVTARLLKVKTTSVQREIRSLSALWSRCADVLDIRNRNPFANQPIKGLGTDAVKRHTATLEETQKLLQVLEVKAVKAPESYVWPLIAIAALAGTRLSEAWGLSRDDWLQDDGTLFIRPNTNRQNLKTTNSVRPIPVLDPLAVWLDRYFTCVDVNRVPKTANSASAGTVKALKRQGFAFGNHSLRHGMKQRLFEVDTPSNVYEELMGWSSQSMAANYGKNLATTAKRRYLAAVYQDLGVMPKTDGNVVALTNGTTKVA